ETGSQSLVSYPHARPPVRMCRAGPRAGTAGAVLPRGQRTAGAASAASAVDEPPHRRRGRTAVRAGEESQPGGPYAHAADRKPVAFRRFPNFGRDAAL
ncbi:MAG: hypothetical protein AVDCRST_MAG89-2859, partial [uncultured Gemmatimonadetes bacterium]